MANFDTRARTFFDFETLTISSSAVSLTEATYDPTPGPGAAYTLMSVEADQIRFRLDGTAPTATVGHLVNVGDTIELHGNDNIRNFRAIRVTADATLTVSYAR